MCVNGGLLATISLVSCGHTEVTEVTSQQSLKPLSAAAPSKGVIVLAMAASGADLAFHPFKNVQITKHWFPYHSFWNKKNARKVPVISFGLKRFPLGRSSAARPTRRAAILEELAAAAGEEGTVGDDEAERLGGENLDFVHLKFLKIRLKGEGGAWRDQGRPCPRHPLHVLLHPLLEDRLHRGQCWIPSDDSNLPHLLHTPWLHSPLHLCSCHQRSCQRWWCLFHAFQNNGTRVWRIHW